MVMSSLQYILAKMKTVGLSQNSQEYVEVGTETILQKYSRPKKTNDLSKLSVAVSRSRNVLLPVLTISTFAAAVMQPTRKSFSGQYSISFLSIKTRFRIGGEPNWLRSYIATPLFSPHPLTGRSVLSNGTTMTSISELASQQHIPLFSC